MGCRVVHGENECWVHVLSVFLFYKSIVKTCYELEEVTCCFGAWLVIQLGGGVEQTVELLPPMVGRS